MSLIHTSSTPRDTCTCSIRPTSASSTSVAHCTDLGRVSGLRSAEKDGTERLCWAAPRRAPDSSATEGAVKIEGRLKLQVGSLFLWRFDQTPSIVHLPLEKAPERWV